MDRIKFGALSNRRRETERRNRHLFRRNIVIIFPRAAREAEEFGVLRQPVGNVRRRLF